MRENDLERWYADEPAQPRRPGGGEVEPAQETQPVATGILDDAVAFLAKSYKTIYYAVILLIIGAPGAFAIYFFMDYLSGNKISVVLAAVMALIAAVAATVVAAFKFLWRGGKEGDVYYALLLVPGRPLFTRYLPPPLPVLASNPLSTILSRMATVLVYIAGIAVILGFLLVVAGNILNSMFSSGRNYWGGMTVGSEMARLGVEILVNGILVLSLIYVEVKPDVMAIENVASIEDLNSGEMGPFARTLINVFKFVAG